ncbi:hypothetical protein BDV06DRAFT_232181 [Aspergillus oleicola]
MSFPQSSCNTFPLFPLLPAELRLQIWKLCLSESRTVRIKCHRAVHPVHKRRYARAFEFETGQPPLLSVNQEARIEALSVYRPSFLVPGGEDDVPASISESRMEEGEAREQRVDGHVHGDSPGDGGCKGQEPGHVLKQEPRPIYIAFDRETIQLREDVLSYIPGPELCLIQTMIVDVADVHYFGHFYLDILRSMTKLKTLDLVVRVTDSDRLLAGRGNGTGDEALNGAEHGRILGGYWGLQRGLDILEDEFIEMRAVHPDWDFPEVRVVMRDTGAVVGRIRGDRESLVEEGGDVAA